MTEKQRREIEEIRREYEDEIGTHLLDEFVEEVEGYCERKVERIGKSIEYLPILFRCELREMHQAKIMTDFTLRIMREEEMICVQNVG